MTLATDGGLWSLPPKSELLDYDPPPLRPDLLTGTPGTMRLVELSQDDSRALFALNRDNRPIDWDRVRKYATDMTAGRWQLTGDTVKIDTNGHVRDGQKRLLAHMSCPPGTVWPVYLFEGLDPAAMGVLDGQQPRTAAQDLSIHGVRHATTVVGAVGALLALDSGATGSTIGNTNRVATNAQLLGWVRDHPDVVEQIQAATLRFRGNVPALTPRIVIAQYLRMHRIDADTADYLFDRLGDGRGLYDNDPVFVLRNRMIRQLESRGRSRPAQWPNLSAHLLAKCWNQLAHGEQVTKIQYPTVSRATRSGAMTVDVPALSTRIAPAPVPSSRRP